MKIIKLIQMFIVFTLLASGCDKDPLSGEIYSTSDPEKGNKINGTWKHSPTSSSYLIEYVTSTSSGSGTVAATGSAFPPGALYGPALSKVTYGKGLYWEALSHTYYPSSGWTTSYTIIGINMASDFKTFKIGNATYTKQP